MKRICAFLLLLVVALGWSSARAADWVPVTVAGSSNQYFYDRSKLKILDESITYWQKVVFHTPLEIKGGEAVSALLRERMDCEEHTVLRLAHLYYSANGEVLERDADNVAEEPIIPDTAGDAFEHVLCPQVWQKQEEVRLKAGQLDEGSSEPPVVAEKPPAKPEPPPPPPMPQAIEQLY